jgi:segregation and condensation protein B
MEGLKQIIQAILFVSPYALPEEEILRIVQKDMPMVTIEELAKALLDIRAEFQRPEFGIEIQRTGMGYSFVSKPQYYPFVVNYIETIQRKRLSKSALETLSIIAFQPDSTKVDIEQIRGVSADYAVEKLMERELIVISGRKEVPGNPAMYRTSTKFLDYFGLDSLEDLPKFENIRSQPLSEIGQIEEDDQAMGIVNTQNDPSEDDNLDPLN